LFLQGSAPGLEGLEGRLHGFFGVLRAGFLVDADDLGRAGRVEGADFGLGLEAAAADDEVVFAPSWLWTKSNAGLHIAVLSGALKSMKGSLAKTPPVRAAESGGERGGFHDVFSLVQTENGDKQTGTGMSGRACIFEW